SVRAALRLWAAAAGCPPARSRRMFYLHWQRRLSWELGLELQKRSPAERDQAVREWTDLTACIARRGYPDPFTA
ncbi:MAG: hypothetical protein ACRD1E_06985, partial [Terriglobales bacterium]